MNSVLLREDSNEIIICYSYLTLDIILYDKYYD